MLTWEDDVEVHALAKRGWTISAIARHTGHDRKTIRAYLNGVRSPGQRKKPDEDPFEPFAPYVTARLAEDLTRLIDLPQVCSLKFPTRRRLLL